MRIAFKKKRVPDVQGTAVDQKTIQMHLCQGKSRKSRPFELSYQDLGSGVGTFSEEKEIMENKSSNRE